MATEPVLVRASGTEPLYIRRFSRTERTLHWVHASAFMVLLGSGLVLYVPRLSEAVGRRPLVKDIHFDTGLAWMLAIALIVVLGDRRGLRRTLRELDSFDRDVVVRYLKRDGFDTLEAADGETAQKLIERGAPELVVLDVMLPGTDGLALCRWIRSRGQLPVIMLTARGEEADRIVGLELGADDYVTKPFSPRELAARVRTVLRRSAVAAPTSETIAFGEIELDGVSRETRRGGSAVQLTAKEFELLWFLASHPRHVFSRDQLMARVWGYEAAVDTGTVTVHVRRLREKIEPDPAMPQHLRTVWGVGYRLDP